MMLEQPARTREDEWPLAPTRHHTPSTSPAGRACRPWRAAGSPTVLGRAPDDIVAVRRLPGSTSSVLHELVLRDGGRRRSAAPTQRRAAPLRPSRLAGRRRPARPHRGQHALAAATSAPVAAPALLAVDPEGEARRRRRPADDPAAGPAAGPSHAGLAGRAGLDPRAPGRLDRPVARTLPCRRTSPGSRPSPACRRGRAGRTPGPRPSPWSPPPCRRASRSGPIHRDLHPANILFRRGRAERRRGLGERLHRAVRVRPRPLPRQPRHPGRTRGRRCVPGRRRSPRGAALRPGLGPRGRRRAPARPGAP